MSAAAYPPPWWCQVYRPHSIGWFVLEGTLQFIFEREELSLDAGGWLYSPKGVPHTFRNAPDAPARVLLLAVPSGLEGFFRDVGRKLAQNDDPRPPTEADIDRVMETAPKYGLDIHAPDSVGV